MTVLLGLFCWSICARSVRWAVDTVSSSTHTHAHTVFIGYRVSVQPRLRHPCPATFKASLRDAMLPAIPTVLFDVKGVVPGPGLT